jgi:basic membrane protein A
MARKHAVDRRSVLKSLGVAGTAGLAGLAGCTGGSGGTGGSEGSGSSDSTESSSGADGSGGGSETVKAAWIYNSEVGDLGWSWAHNEGRKAAAERFDWLETDYSEAVAPADAERVVREYTMNGYDIVFGGTFEYMDPMLAVAEENPDTLYEHCAGYKTADNMGRYFGRMYEARYLAGVAAGMVTEADSLGYVAAFPIPEVVRGINAYAAGAASVNEAASVRVQWVNSWFDPPKEREAAQALIDGGVDVMAQHQDSPAAVRAAADAGIWATGYDAPMGEFAGENYLTSPIWHWEVFYEPTLQAVNEGSWESDAYWGGLTDGIVDVDEWGPAVPDEVKSTVQSERKALEAGDLDVWADTAFAGDSDASLFGEMSSYVDNVEGSVPNN